MDRKFCQNLKEARKQCGLTQKQAALSLDVVESCYANWEQGRTEPNVDMLRKLGKLFSMSIDDLINGEYYVDREKCRKMENSGNEGEGYWQSEINRNVCKK